jgi:hypothetical protein
MCATGPAMHCSCCPRFPADNPDATDLHLIERGGKRLHGEGCPHPDVSADPRHQHATDQRRRMTDDPRRQGPL